MPSRRLATPRGRHRRRCARPCSNCGTPRWSLGAPWFPLLRISSRKLATRMSASKTTFVGDLSTLTEPCADCLYRARGVGTNVLKHADPSQPAHLAHNIGWLGDVGRDEPGGRRTRRLSGADIGNGIPACGARGVTKGMLDVSRSGAVFELSRGFQG